MKAMLAITVGITLDDCGFHVVEQDFVRHTGEVIEGQQQRVVHQLE
ncbi:UNVERIFIED_ORG: hypothetical protein J2W16_001213 [Pseudomonas cremoricolorata]|nr:hypothetical protein [Pseudomonas cremoricolorata]